MSVANDGLLLALGQNQFTINDDMAAQQITQALATKCIGQVCRFTTSTATATASAILPSLLTQEAQSPVFVVNDTPNTVRVYPFVGETEGGVTNSALSIPTGQSGIFVKINGAAVGKGGGQTAVVNDWRVAIIP